MGSDGKILEAVKMDSGSIYAERSVTGSLVASIFLAFSHEILIANAAYLRNQISGSLSSGLRDKAPVRQLWTRVMIRLA